MGEQIKFAERPLEPTKGSAGLKTQLPGCATTIGNVASATGGIGTGRAISTDRQNN